MIETHCSQCGKPLLLKPSRFKQYTNHFCSRSCHFEFQRVFNHCGVCGKQVARRRKFCSRACSNKSRRGTHYRGSETKNRAEKVIRLKAELFELCGYHCERCPYSRTDIIQLHHIVPRSQGGTDEHSNLELLCPNCHAEHHYGT